MYFLIEGDRPLKGTVTSQGAKNSAVHLIAASLLTKDEVILENVPLIDDIYKMAKILEGIGSCVQIKERDHIIYIKSGVALNPIINDPLASELRASLSFVGALLGRIKEASLIFPGGCNIGTRPVDFHLKGFSLLGAQTSLEHGAIIAKAKRLTGNRIYLDYPSVGATINLILASCLARGETILENIVRGARDPGPLQHA